MTERQEWLRFQMSQEVAASVAPGLGTGDAAATAVLVRWLTDSREQLINHCFGAINSTARAAGLDPFTRDEIAHEVRLMAWCHRIRD